MSDDVGCVAGRVWVFGDHVSTDLIMPGAQVLAGGGLGRPPESWCFHAIRPNWADEVAAGDVLAAGRNFGCGSGRNAPALLKRAGIAAVVAESLSRAFFRNAVNCALPALECPGVTGILSEGDQVEIDVSSGSVTNLATGERVVGDAWPPESPPMQILAAGGIEAYAANLLEQDR